jgi:hypothetical protein
MQLARQEAQDRALAEWLQLELADGDAVNYRTSRTGRWEPATLAAVSWAVEPGEAPEVAVRLPGGAVRDTTLARVRPRCT